MNKEKKLIVGSRNSRMALAQTNEFIDAFLRENTDFNRENIEIRPVTTSCLLYTSPSPRDGLLSRMPSSA